MCCCCWVRFFFTFLLLVLVGGKTLNFRHFMSGILYLYACEGLIWASHCNSIQLFLLILNIPQPMTVVSKWEPIVIASAKHRIWTLWPRTV